MKEQASLSFPQDTTLYSYPLVLSHFSTAFHPPSNLAQKHSALTTSLGLPFLMKTPLSHIKLILNKFVCFSLINLSC